MVPVRLIGDRKTQCYMDFEPLLLDLNVELLQPSSFHDGGAKESRQYQDSRAVLRNSKKPGQVISFEPLVEA